MLQKNLNENKQFYRQNKTWISNSCLIRQSIVPLLTRQYQWRDPLTLSLQSLLAGAYFRNLSRELSARWDLKTSKTIDFIAPPEYASAFQ